MSGRLLVVTRPVGSKPPRLAYSAHLKAKERPDSSVPLLQLRASYRYLPKTQGSSGQNLQKSSVDGYNRPALILRDRRTFLNGNDVTNLELVVFVVRLVLLRATDSLLE